MDGFEIPIGGDIAPFMQAIAELKAEIRNLANSINKAFAPARQATQEIAKSTRELTVETKKGSRGFIEMGKSAVGVITTTAAITGALVSVAAHIPQIIRLGRTIGMSLREPIQQAATQTVSLGQKMRQLMASPTFKVIAVSAIAAGVAIGGTVIAVRTVTAAFRRLSAFTRGVFSGISAAAKATASAVRGTFATITPGGSGGGLLGPLAGLVAAGGAVALITSQLKGAFTAAAAFESLQTRVESFTGSTKAAKDLLSELARFGDVTPFENIDLQETGAKLLGAGLRDNIAGITKDIAAISKDGQTMLELADALGKGFAKGKFQTEELNKFLERGINLMPTLTAVTGLSGAALQKAIEKGLKFEDVAAAISMMSAKGGQFYGVLGRLSKTFEGLWSTFLSSWSSVKKAFAQPILESLKPLLQQATALLEPMKQKAAAAGKAIGDIFLTSFALIKSGQSFALIKSGLSIAFLTAVDILNKGMRGAVAFLATALPPVIAAAFAKFSDPNFWKGMLDIFRAAALIFSAEINRALGRTEEATNLSNSAEGFAWRGSSSMRNAGQVDFTGELIKALRNGKDAMLEQIKGPKSPALQKAIENWEELSKRVAATVADLKSKASVPAPQKGAGGAGIGTRSDGATDDAAGSQRAALAVKSLTRIGGGGGGGSSIVAPMVTQQVRTNRLLADLVRNTKQGAAKPPTAVYA